MKLNHEDHGIDKNAFNLALGRRLCALRLHHEKSQRYVGEKLGVSYQQVHKYETGETQIAPAHLLIYAKIFNVSIASLYGAARESNDVCENSGDARADPDTLLRDIRTTLIHLTRQINKAMGERER